MILVPRTTDNGFVVCFLRLLFDVIDRERNSWDASVAGKPRSILERISAGLNRDSPADLDS